MKKIVLFLALSFCQFTFAQEINIEQTIAAANAELTILKQDLKLDADQEEKIKYLLEGIYLKNAAITADNSISADEKQSAITSNNTSKREILLSYLSADQKKQLK